MWFIIWTKVSQGDPSSIWKEKVSSFKRPWCLNQPLNASVLLLCYSSNCWARVPCILCLLEVLRNDLCSKNKKYVLCLLNVWTKWWVIDPLSKMKYVECLVNSPLSSEYLNRSTRVYLNNPVKPVRLTLVLMGLKRSLLQALLFRLFQKRKKHSTEAKTQICKKKLKVIDWNLNCRQILAEENMKK